MKKILLFVMAAGLTGCDLLDSQGPRQSLPVESVTDDAQGLRSLVTGLYDGIQEAEIAGGNYNILPEIMSDNVLWSGTFANYQRVHNHTMIPENPTANWWILSYQAVNMANLIIEQAAAIEDPELSPAEAEIILGDAYFIRGMLYFELARVFSRPWWTTGDGSHEGVPLRTTAVTDIDSFENLPRSSLAASFERTEADLLQAAERLPDTGVRSNSGVDPNGSGRATRYSALGYLMRLEMTRRNHAAAADYAGLIIDSDHFELTDHPADPFLNEFSAESIFEIIHTATDNPGVNAGQNAFYAPAELGGRGDIEISGSFVGALNSVVTAGQRAVLDLAGLEAVDLRLELLTSTTPGLGATTKFPDGAGNTDNVMNMRYADILLSRAESLAETAADLGDVPGEVYDRLNEVRTRSVSAVDPLTGAQAPDELIEYAPSDFSNKQELLDAILLERRIELAFEGDRFHTLQRKGLEVRGVMPDDNRFLFPIPQAEVDTNPLIDQHGDY